MDAYDPLWTSARARALVADRDIGGVLRLARQARRWRQADVGAAAGYSASTISRLETGCRAGADLGVLRRVAGVLAIPPAVFSALTGLPTLAGATVARTTGQRAEEDDSVRRRRLLASLAATAAVSAIPLPAHSISADGADTGESLITRIGDAMLGLDASSADWPAARLRSGLDAALADFHHCRYRHLASSLPRLIRGAHAAAADSADPAVTGLLAEVYTLTTRMLIKLDDQQLGWLAADRARTFAGGAGDPLVTAEAARNLAVLARKAGWHSRAMTIALSAADRSELRTAGTVGAAERGLLIQSAAYSAAKDGDRSTMRDLTGEAAAIATHLHHTTTPVGRGGEFTPTTVQLHRISAEYSVGEAGAALAAAAAINPARLPTTERRARFYTDLAQAYSQHGRRAQAINALIVAEHHAPEEVRTRPAIRALITGLLTSGPTTPELKGLAARCALA